jgi:hypothetical protein
MAHAGAQENNVKSNLRVTAKTPFPISVNNGILFIDRSKQVRRTFEAVGIARKEYEEGLPPSIGEQLQWI